MIDRPEVQEKLKYCFDICVRNKFNKKLISQIAEKIGIKTKQIFNNAEDYYKNYATEEEKQSYQNNIVKKEEKSQVKDITQEQIIMFEKVLKSSTKEEYIKEYKDSKISISKLKQLVIKYLNKLKIDTNISLEQEENIKNILNITINEYEKYIELKKKEDEEEEKKRKEEILPKAETYVALIIESDNLNYDEIYSKYQISKEDLKYFVEIVKENNQALYEEYQNKIKRKKAETYQLIVEKLKDICKRLKKDIEENNVSRFNIVDYFMITKININEMLKIAEHECNKEELYLFKMFCQDNNNLSEINMKKLLKIGQEDIKIKQSIISYMKENKLPMLEKIYYILLEKYQRNELNIRIK